MHRSTLTALVSLLATGCSFSTGSAHLEVDYLESQGYERIVLLEPAPAGGTTFQAFDAEGRLCTGSVGATPMRQWLRYACGGDPGARCLAEHPEACELEAVRERTTNPERAMVALQRACVHGSERACRGFHEPSEVEEAASRAVSAIGCARGDAYACLFDGYARLQEGEHALATVLLARSCGEGFGPACIDVAAVHYRYGANPAVAKKWLGRGCATGSERACELLRDFRMPSPRSEG
ncbi:MAG: hypothetical protein R3F61_22865 [Myxococcota bacterium]